MEALWATQPSLCRPYAPSLTLGGMLTVAIVAAGGSGYGTFIAGFLIGAGIGFLLGPAVRSWLAYREWADASRQARLTEEILARMEQESGLRERTDSQEAWPASH
jgi:uncharacterized membrane protein